MKKQINPELLARLLVLGLSLGAVLLPLALRLANNTLELHARLAEDGGWSQAALRAQVGRPLHLRLASDDVMHGFAVGRMDMQAVDIEPGKPAELTLLFERPGTYTFYCTRWCGVNHWRMRGIITVTGGSPQPATDQPPLYVSLGLDIDAPHPAAHWPSAQPSALAGGQFASQLAPIHRTGAYYRSHSPAQLYEDLAALSGLSDSQRWDLVAYVWAANTTPAALAQAAQKYAQNCAACHGASGGGDGIFAEQIAGLVAPAMSASGPANFSDPARMLGASPALLQGKLLRGGMGTGMPMWGSIFSDRQLWDLVAFLYSFQFKETK